MFVYFLEKMFCPLTCVDNSETMLEEYQNLNNWSKVAVPVPRRKRFLARKIHKLKKVNTNYSVLCIFFEFNLHAFFRAFFKCFNFNSDFWSLNWISNTIPYVLFEVLRV